MCVHMCVYLKRSSQSETLLAQNYEWKVPRCIACSCKDAAPMHTPMLLPSFKSAHGCDPMTLLECLLHTSLSAHKEYLETSLLWDFSIVKRNKQSFAIVDS